MPAKPRMSRSSWSKAAIWVLPLILAAAGCSRSELRVGFGPSGANGGAGGAGTGGQPAGGFGAGGHGAGGHGTGGQGASGGTGPSVPLCGRVGPAPDPSELLAYMEYGFAASWMGMATTPPGWMPSAYPVAMTFRPDGSYHAECLIPDCVALYWGIDDDSPLKIYELIDVKDNLEGWGEIDIVFGAGNAVTGVLGHIAVAGDLSQLTFELTQQGYGPVVYSLACELP